MTAPRVASANRSNSASDPLPAFVASRRRGDAAGPGRVAGRGRLEQQGIDHAEGDGVDAHADGEREHGRGRERRPPAELPNGETQILKEAVHPERRRGRGADVPVSAARPGLPDDWRAQLDLETGDIVPGAELDVVPSEIDTVEAKRLHRPFLPADRRPDESRGGPGPELEREVVLDGSGRAVPDCRSNPWGSPRL